MILLAQFRPAPLRFLASADVQEVLAQAISLRPCTYHHAYESSEETNSIYPRCSRCRHAEMYALAPE